MGIFLTSLLFFAASGEPVKPVELLTDDVIPSYLVNAGDRAEWGSAKQQDDAGKKRVQTGTSILNAPRAPSTGAGQETPEQIKVRAQKIIKEGEEQSARAMPSLERLRKVATARYLDRYSPEFSSGTLLLAADSLPLRKQELVVGPPGQTAIVRGTARDQRSQPLGNVMVEVDGLPGSWTSDAQGRFALSAIPTGTRTILARALGYAPVIQQVDVLAKDNEDIAISMTRSTRLPNVTVNAVADKGPVVREYEERKKRGFGWFTDSLQFKNRADTRSIFQGAPGLQIDADNSRSLSEFKIYMPYTMGHCLANIYLDGFRSDAQMLSGLPKQQIAAVEVYMRPGEVPGKYLPFDSICGTVLVWTKQAFEPPPAKKSKKL